MCILSRLAAEVAHSVIQLKESGRQVARVSFIGYSLVCLKATVIVKCEVMYADALSAS